MFREVKHMRIYYRILSLMLCALTLLSTGCRWLERANGGKQTTEQTAEAETAPQYLELSELGEYRIIRGEEADEATIAAAAHLHSLLTKLGAKVKFDTDYVKKGEEIPKSAKEIVVGETNRSETQNLRYSDFSVCYQNGRILIDGGSADALEGAAKWLCSSCISDGKLWLNNLPYTYYAEYSMEDLKVFGVALKEFSVELGEGDADDQLLRWIGSRVGVRRQSENGYVLKVVADKTLDLNEINVELVEKELRLCASAHLGDMNVVVDYFLDAIKTRSGNELSFPGKDRIEMPEPTVELKDIRDVTANVKLIFAETDQDPLAYVIGDDVVFACTLYADSEVVSCPQFTWNATTDDGQVYMGESDGSHGKIIIKIPATGTGNIRLMVYAKDEYGAKIPDVKQSEFSVVVNANSITAKKEEPADFDAFWAEQIAKVNAVSPDVISMEKVTSPTGVQGMDGASSSTSGHDFYRVKVQTPSECGYAVGYLTVPKNASSLGITVVFNGYGVGDLSPYVSPTRIVLNVCAHSYELGQDSSYYSALSNGSLANYGFTNTANRDTVYFRTMIMRDLQMVRFIKAYAGTEGVLIDGVKSSLNVWNGKLNLYGGSQGAFQGIAVAALDHDVTDAYWYIPWMCDIGGSRSEFRPTYTAALGYYDTVFFGKRVSSDVNVTLTAGLADYICPPSGVVALYNALNANVVMYFKQSMTHSYTPAKTSTTIYQK